MANIKQILNRADKLLGGCTASVHKATEIGIPEDCYKIMVQMRNELELFYAKGNKKFGGFLGSITQEGNNWTVYGTNASIRNLITDLQK